MKIPKIGILILISLSLFIHNKISYSQNRSNLTTTYKVLNPFDKNVPSPEASSLAMDIENPVGLYTGSITYSLPLYQIEVKDFRLDITLNYSNNGIKVNQISSNVGLGWSLGAGGVITREIRGVRDEINFNGYTSESGWRTNNYFINNNFNIYNTNHVNHLINMAEGIMDGEPDKYYFNFGSYSGSFIFDHNNNIHFIPDQNFKVEVQRSGNTAVGQSNHIISFTITVDEGTKYVFGSAESHRDQVNYDYLGVYSNRESVYNNINNPLARKYISWNVAPSHNQDYYTAWYLSEIILPTCDEHISFEYESDQVYTYLGTTEQYMAGPGGPDGNPSLHVFDPNDPLILVRTNRYRLSKNSRLRSINWNGGRVDFIKSETPRQDINDLTDSKGYSISRIEVYTASDQFVKEVNLAQSYFNNTGGGTEYNEYTSYFKRLKLDAVTINDQIYNFYYIHDDSNPQLKFPSRNTVEMDFWGYYTKLPVTNFGAPTLPYGNRASKPSIYVYPDDFNNDLYRSAYSIWPRTQYEGTEIIIEGNDKTPNLQYAQIGMLKKIQLPTGGLIEYTYELNDFFFDGVTRNGGGIRVDTVCFSDGSNHYNDRVITYEYVDENNNSSGRITTVPDFAMQNIHARFEEVNWFYLSAFSNNPSLKQAVGAIRFNDSKSGLGGTHGGYVGYTSIKQIENNGSYTEYLFDIPVTAETNQFFQLNGDDYLYSKPIRKRYINPDNQELLFHFPNNYIGYSQPLWIDNAPFFAMPEIDWCRGNLLKERYYNETGVMIKEVEYQYEIVPSENLVYYCQSSIYNIFHASFLVLDSGIAVFGPFDLYQWDIVYGLNKYTSGRKNLTRRIEKEYSQNTVFTRQESSEYNSQGYIKNRTVVLNTEEEHALYEYIHVSDFIYNLLVEQCYDQYQQCIDDANDIYEQCENVCVQYYSNPPELLQSCIELCLYDHQSNLIDCNYPLQNCLAGISHHFTPMLEKNMLSLPVEIRTSLQRDGEPLKQTSGKVYNYNTYDPEDNSFLQLVEVLILETDEPLTNSDYVTLDEFGDLIIPSVYKSEEEYTKYDHKGNVNEVKLKNDQTTTYLWGYNNTLLIAKTENASYEQVAYSSFEDNGTSQGLDLGNWNLLYEAAWYRITTSIIGDYALRTFYNGSIIETTQTIPPGEYMLSFYSKETTISIPQAASENIHITFPHISNYGDWHKYDVKILLNQAAKIQVHVSNTTIDDLRLYPANAQMTSYTYKPLIGVSSITDPSGRTTFYEYDSFGRLQYIKNHEGHYLQNFDYHYRVDD